MKQLTLIPEPTKQDLIAEMLELWIAYLTVESASTPLENREEKRQAHRRYYTLMFQIKDKYGLPYHELRLLLRGAARRENEFDGDR